MSEKSVAQKLGLKPGKTLFVSHAPAPVADLFGATPDGAHVTATGKGPFSADPGVRKRSCGDGEAIAAVQGQA
jgi:hypothetical protein